MTETSDIETETINPYERQLPALADAAACVLARGRTELFLPLRRLAGRNDEARPSNLVLHNLASTARGQTAFTVAVLRGLAEGKKRKLAETELREVYGLDDGTGLLGGADGMLEPSAGLLRMLGRLLLGRELRPRARVRLRAEERQQQRDKLEKIKASSGGKARLDKASDRLYSATIYAGAIGGYAPAGSAAELGQQLVAAMDPDRTVAEGDLLPARVDAREAFAARARRVKSSVLVSPEELAAAFAPPDGASDTSGLTMASTAVPALDAPSWMESSWRPGLIRLGEVMPGTDRARVVCMNIDDLSGSAYLTGRSGTGKSTWLEGILRDLCLAPQGATFCIDPNATLNRHALMLLAKQHPELLRSGKVAAIDWSDPDYSPTWNPLVARTQAEAEIGIFTTVVLVTALNVGGLEQLVRGKGYLEAAIRNLAEANLAIHQAAAARGDDPAQLEYLTPLDLRRYFTSDDFRALLLRFANLDVHQRFTELAELKPQERRGIFESLLHRLDTLANVPTVALIADCPRNAIWWEDDIEAGRTVLHSLDVLGANSAASLGVLPTLLAQYFRCAENLWTHKGRPVGDELRRIVSVMVADEVQNLAAVAGEELVRALAMLRKTGVRLLGASQYQRQMIDAGGAQLGEAIRLNVAHRLSFMVPATEGKGLDAAALDRERGVIDGATLANLPRFHLIASLDLTRPDGQTEQTSPFVLHSIDPQHPRPGDPDYEQVISLVESVYQRGRELYCRPRAGAEQERREHEQRIRAELHRALGPRNSPVSAPAAATTQPGPLAVDGDSDVTIGSDPTSDDTDPFADLSEIGFR